MAGKKLFTTIMNYTGSISAGADAWSRSALSFEAQEDITIVALDMSAYIRDVIVLAGAVIDESILKLQLSQAGEENDEGVIGQISVALNSILQGAITPNQVTTKTSENKYIMLPSGITIKEDGDVNLHVYSYNSAASAVVMAGDIIIYYVKG